MIAPDIIFDGKLVWFTVMSLQTSRFVLITPRRSLKDVTYPLLGLDGEGQEVYGTTRGQDSTFCAVMNAQF